MGNTKESIDTEVVFEIIKDNYDRPEIVLEREDYADIDDLNKVSYIYIKGYERALKNVVEDLVFMVYEETPNYNKSETRPIEVLFKELDL